MIMLNDKKTLYLITIVTSVLMIMSFATYRIIRDGSDTSKEAIIVGFVYDGDESTPYTANFIKAQKALERKLGKKVKIHVKSNILDKDGVEQALADLVDSRCDIIFTTSFGYGEATKKYAGMYPDIQFCQATCLNANDDPAYGNYHTFMGEIYEGRYITGAIAGMKLQEMIDNGTITKEEAKIGYVAAYPIAEVISGYTAFLLGARSECPDAVMEVKYTNTWSSYTIEKSCADKLIDDGCVLISQHSNTTGPAVACEERYAEKTVYHVGYNQSMIDVAPTTSMISCRINWESYVIGACEAVLADEKIEDYVEGVVHGNDIGAGFDKGWVDILELNSLIAAPGSQEKIDELKKKFVHDDIDVFRGDYTGVDPEDPSKTIDLKNGYKENEKYSAPTFSYVLKDVITIIE